MVVEVKLVKYSIVLIQALALKKRLAITRKLLSFSQTLNNNCTDITIINK